MITVMGQERDRDRLTLTVEAPEHTSFSIRPTAGDAATTLACQSTTLGDGPVTRYLVRCPAASAATLVSTISSGPFGYTFEHPLH